MHLFLLEDDKTENVKYLELTQDAVFLIIARTFD